MGDHDSLCYAASPEHFPTVMFGGEPTPCDCDLIARVRADEREKIAKGMRAEARDFQRAVQKKNR